ncbi:protein kinase domain-containing protein [Paraburkholderia phosphatilytica]|uniref:protein kinase domain-containing protein n=1 Tax=Paraburkholderia phosphatilytica TaxID=2282883 RepID=UPI000E4DBD2D|nr:protein kinase [Paraburkholderia phosphatilytica]
MSSPDDKTVIVRPPSEPDGQPASAEPTDDDDRTVVMSTPPAPGSAHQALANGTRLAEFEIVGLIGEGGFGIVYLAYDTQLRRNVALKEYIPAALAARVGLAEVTVRSERHAETFRAGLKSFINEARLLAQFDHHSLVKVYRFWEANGTAYMVMPYYEGVTLRDTLRQQREAPDEAWLRGLLGPLVDALAVLHAAQCYHRDIAPDNIMLLKGSGRPLLLDFGAARRVIGDMTQALTVILKPGYAPVEQYAEVASMKQGPWTDIYALAAVVYFAIQGKTPPPSVGRLLSDNYVPLATTAAGRYTERFLRAIDHALAVRPEDRPQSVHALAEEMELATQTPANANGSNSTSSAMSFAGEGTVMPRAERTGQASAAATPPATQPVEAARSSQASPRTPMPPGAASALAGGDAKRGRTGMIAGLAAGVVVLVAIGGWVALHRPATTTSTASSSAPASAVPQVTPPPAQAETAQPQTAPGALAQASAPPDTGTTAAAQPPASPDNAASAAAAAVTAAAALPPYTPGGEFDRIVSLADPSFHVTVGLRSATARIGKDHLQFKVSSSRNGYVYVFMVDPAGQYLMIFPNGIDRNNAIGAQQTLSLPRANWPMLAGAPAGPNQFLVIVSAAQRDFSDGGLHGTSVFQGFPADAQREAAARRTASYSPFAGKPNCAAGVTDCPDAFGATTFRIDVVNSST